MRGWIVLWLKYCAQSSTQSQPGTVFVQYLIFLIFSKVLKQSADLFRSTGDGIGTEFHHICICHEKSTYHWSLCLESLFGKGKKKRQFCSTVCCIIRQLSKIGQVSPEEPFLPFIKTQILSSWLRDKSVLQLLKMR